MFSRRAWEGSNPANPTTGKQGVLLEVGGVVLVLLRKGGVELKSLPPLESRLAIILKEGGDGSNTFWGGLHHQFQIQHMLFQQSRTESQLTWLSGGTHSPLDLLGAGGSPSLTSDLAWRRKSRSWRSRGKISGMLTCSQWFFKKSSKQFSSWSWSFARSYCTDVFKHLN